MRRSKGYADELEKLTRNDSDVSITVKLKAAATKKLRDRRVLAMGIFLHNIKRRTNHDL